MTTIIMCNFELNRNEDDFSTEFRSSANWRTDGVRRKKGEQRREIISERACGRLVVVPLMSSQLRGVSSSGSSHLSSSLNLRCRHHPASAALMTMKYSLQSRYKTTLHEARPSAAADCSPGSSPHLTTEHDNNINKTLKFPTVKRIINTVTLVKSERFLDQMCRGWTIRKRFRAL